MSTRKVKTEARVTVMRVTRNYAAGSRCMQRILDISLMVMTTTPGALSSFDTAPEPVYQGVAIVAQATVYTMIVANYETTN